MYLPSMTAPIQSGSLTAYRVAASATPVMILSGGMTNRRVATIYNHSNASLFIGPFPEVGVTRFMTKITSGSHFTMPNPIYVGPVYGVWDAAAGHAMIVDFNSSES